ncbi:MAG: hypothetical protein Q4C60_00175 [Eubacteriales bacterium]|nr:hypothetical protein [Eubacteriales bacterium]
MESRPHPDFCGPKWWADMDVILEEARNREMQVWILDDSHFPTGYANGALETAPAAFCRQSVFCNEIRFAEDPEMIVLDVEKMGHPPQYESEMLAASLANVQSIPRHFDDDRILSITAVGQRGIFDLDGFVSGGILKWNKPQGEWTVCVCGLSRNCGAHRNYINMMNKESCQLLLDAVYQPHYEHYKEDFGRTIAGFFSDEPELGNGKPYAQHNYMGTMQDLPWSAELEERLAVDLGAGWEQRLPYLWHEEPDKKAAAMVRFTYMELVSRLVEKDFSMPIGNWCRAHGVKYIGHMIEDEGQHCRTGSGLGHYFRGLAGQDMAGIDDIGGQVLPGGEDMPTMGLFGRTRGGEFYHYGLAALAASAAAIDPAKQGRAMCEIFGSYGWKCGPRMEKYLVDHFLVRGINYFVPHAFSPKPYPDPDCPPHFYAHGHNPQYRYFGQIMRYVNRVANLISGGQRAASVAVLYHAEAEWTGRAMPFEKPFRRLYDEQICCDVIPWDVFSDPQRYHTEAGAVLQVNTQHYKALVVPEAQFVTAAAARAVTKLQDSGFPVFFVEALPEGICDGEDTLLDGLRSCAVISLDNLPDAVRAAGAAEMTLYPPDNRVRVLRYIGESHYYLLVNEGEAGYRGCLTVPECTACFGYSAYTNRLERVNAVLKENVTQIMLELEPLKSQIIVFGGDDGLVLHEPLQAAGGAEILEGWKRSQCRGIDYPHFGSAAPVQLPDDLAEEQPAFSGYIRYETVFMAERNQRLVLEISHAEEGVEVFVNGKSLGLSFAPPMLYDLTEAVLDGENQLVIEIATTLERERAAGEMSELERMMAQPPTGKSGLTGSVKLYRQERRSI